MEKFETPWGRIEVENGSLRIVIDDYDLPYIEVGLRRKDNEAFVAFINRTLGEQS